VAAVVDMSQVERGALRLVWSCVPDGGAELSDVANAAGLGLVATLAALTTLEVRHGYVTFDGARWRPLVPCGRQKEAR